MKNLLILIALLSANLSHAQPGNSANDNEETVETFTIEQEVEGEKVIQMIQLFPESLLEMPDFPARAAKMGLDHIAYFSETGESHDAKFKQRLDATGVPIEEVEANPSLFQNLKALWKESFPKPDPANEKEVAAYRNTNKLALISTFGSTASFVFMMATDSNKHPILDWLLMGSTQGFGAYITSRFPKNISHFIQTSWNRIDQKAPPVTKFVKRLSWTLLLSEFYKFGEMQQHLFDPGIQPIVLGNVAVFGVLGGLLTDMNYRAYQTRYAEAEAGHRVAVVNLVLGLLPGMLSSMDLQKHSWMPSIHNFGWYDFRLSGAIMMVQTAVFAYLLIKKPDELFNFTVNTTAAVGNFFKRTGGKIVKPVKMVIKPVKTWFKGLAANCNQLLKGLPPPKNNADPPNDALPQ